MGALARCAATLLEVEVSWSASVTLGPSDTRLAPALARLVTVKGLGPKGVTVAGDTDSSGLNAISLGHALITLPSHHMLLALALPILLVADLRHRAIVVTLAMLAVFGLDGVPVEPLGAGVAGGSPVAIPTPQTGAGDRVAAPR